MNSVTPEIIVTAACEACRVTKADLVSISRKREVSDCRYIIAGLLDELTDLKPAQIATHIGNKHRSMAYFSVDEFKALKSNHVFMNKVKLAQITLEELCGSN